MAKLNAIRVPIQIEYGYMDDNWNWIPAHPKERKENTMKVTQSIKDTLTKSAREDTQKRYAEQRDAYNAYETARAAYEDALKTQTWVNSLTVGSDLQNPSAVKSFSPPVFTKTARSRYFVKSKSGMTKGHYITRFSDGTVDCSCPGFVNRGYCWASNNVKGNGYAFPQWNLSKSLFESNRLATFNQ